MTDRFMNVMVSMSLGCLNGKLNPQTWIANTEIIIEMMKKDYPDFQEDHTGEEVILKACDE